MRILEIYILYKFIFITMSKNHLHYYVMQFYDAVALPQFPPSKFLCLIGGQSCRMKSLQEITYTMPSIPFKNISGNLCVHFKALYKFLTKNICHYISAIKFH